MEIKRVPISEAKGMILKGDCIEVMKAMKPNSVDAIVCDPPYGLEFMGKEWDKLWVNHPNGQKGRINNKGGMDTWGKTPQYQSGQLAQLWHTQWLTEAYRVLKPGGSMLVMGGTRTSHRLACAIEDSGFIIKDTLMWLYGSGFPKAQDLGKMIDKRMGKQGDYGDYLSKDHAIKRKPGNQRMHKGWQRPWRDNPEIEDRNAREYLPATDLAKYWDGFKVGGIKPAYEPIIWAVKPPEGSYVDNVLKWGVGAVNVDECRVGLNGKQHPDGFKWQPKEGQIYGNGKGLGCEREFETYNNKGRFPANVILDEEAGRLLDEQSGMLISGTSPSSRNADKFRGCYGEFKGQRETPSRNGNSGGASRFFYCAKASRGERNAGLEGMEEKEGQAYRSIRKNRGKGYPESTIIKNNHPTVKPIKLFEWLIKLVTREKQVILDPFIGSGTTAIAAHNTNRKCIGIEKEDEYLEIAKRRIEYWERQPKQMEMGI